MNITEFLLFATAFLVAVIGSLFMKHRNKKKSGMIEADERVLHLFQLYTLRITMIFGVAGVVGLAIITLQKRETLEVDVIWLYLLIFMLTLTAGAFLAKRK
jgi:hypothetical protein